MQWPPWAISLARREARSRANVSQDVAARVARVLGVVRQVAALGRNEDLVAAAPPLANGARERASDRPLAPLSAVVDRRVEDVDPEPSATAIEAS